MNRNPLTTIRPTKAATKAAMPHVNPVAWKALFAAAREAHGEDIRGLICATHDRAFFQKLGDATPYSIAITSDERVLFGL